jgi:hypothetical protein
MIYGTKCLLREYQNPVKRLQYPRRAQSWEIHIQTGEEQFHFPHVCPSLKLAQLNIRRGPRLLPQGKGNSGACLQYSVFSEGCPGNEFILAHYKHWWNLHVLDVWGLLRTKEIGGWLVVARKAWCNWETGIQLEASPSGGKERSRVCGKYCISSEG